MRLFRVLRSGLFVLRSGLWVLRQHRSSTLVFDFEVVSRSSSTILGRTKSLI
ncbi:hypothetical protein ZOSMA_3G02120 [Zostera marina]|uniref:Uncharacterized protein n=1 Tax=Zostera marina TaxID=29655 RepID=A0A0K9P687_ZOSMR|nr:hypothetical protein ZOSMA_3G02120 [Zostera marina]